jgi:hypothetical protein
MVLFIQLNYDELKWGKMFNGSDESLKAMERAELITIVQKEGWHQIIMMME